MSLRTPVRTVGWLLVGLMLLGAACSEVQRPKDAAIRGIALGLFASAGGYDYETLLQEIANQGAADVLLVVQWYQTDVSSADLSPARADLARCLQQARRLGLRATVMPIVRLRAGSAVQWRGQLRPQEGAERWFARYRALLLELAQLAQAGGAVRLGIGSELATLEAYEQQWRLLVHEVRGLFTGRIFYSLNWDATEPAAPLPGFLDELDELGVAAYFALAAPGARPQPGELARAWEGPRARLRAVRERLHGRPLFFSELGYPSLESAASSPWNPETDAAIDLRLQQELVDAFCRTYSGQGELAGFFAWNWFGFGGPTDRGYTPRGKPAAVTLAECLRTWR